MSDSLTQDAGRLTLPLVVAAPEPEAQPEWHGWSAAVPLDPQGAYTDAAPRTAVALPPVAGDDRRPVELLAPAGGPEAALAAFHFGADAVYLGLKKFSARAEAENFTLGEVDEITAYAHSLTPRRRVFVTINTLIRQDELAELIEDVAALDAIGVTR